MSASAAAGRSERGRRRKGRKRGERGCLSRWIYRAGRAGGWEETHAYVRTEVVLHKREDAAAEKVCGRWKWKSGK